jgi:2-polyprenyl-3-methyl-5-hydroxy-6-metoxy-1,4-benzoquinol methylase
MDYKTKRVDIYDKKEGMYSILYHLARYRFVGRMLSFTDSALDIGCGYGSGSRYLREFCRRVTGIDVDGEAVARANTDYMITNLNFFTCDVADLEDRFAEWPEFNVITSVDVLEHVSDPEMMVRDCYEILPKGGLFICGTPRKQELAERNTWHNHEFKPTEFYALMEAYFNRVFRFAQNEETVSVFNPETAWYLWAVCVK